MKLKDDELWKEHQANKMFLFSKILERTGVELDAKS